MCSIFISNSSKMEFPYSCQILMGFQFSKMGTKSKFREQGNLGKVNWLMKV